MAELELAHSYDAGFLAGSIAIAAFGGYVSLWLIDRVGTRGEAGSPGPERRWLAAAAAAMGVGIWSMHFTGMLALRLPVRVGYDPGFTLLSAAIAFVASLSGLAVLREERVGAVRLGGAAALMGSAIAGMHYTGMAAMRFPGEMRYRPSLALASLAVGVVASAGALWLFLRHRDRGQEKRTPAQKGKLLGGLLLGLAVSGLHYVAMAGVRFRNLRPGATLPADGLLLTDSLARWVGGGSVLLLAVGLLAAALDRRLQGEYAEELRRSRSRYETLLEEISDVVMVLDEDGGIRYQSPSVENVFGFRPTEREGRSAFELLHPDDVQKVRDAFAESVSTGETRTVQYRGRHAAGGWVRLESSSTVPRDDSLGGMVVVTRDISDRAEAEEKYRAIFETTPSAVGLATRDEGRFLDVN